MILSKIDALRNYKLSIRMKYTIISVLVVGVFAHLYMYMNRIVNHDAVFALKFSGASISSGRWFLYLLSEIAYVFNNNYMTPWGIGAIVLVLYAITACILVKTFDIKSNLLCFVLGAVLIAFPTVTSTNLYIFTAHYYAFAVLLSCASVLLVKTSGKIIAVLFSSLLISLSLGIYQAYLPFILTMYVLLVLFDCLNKDQTALSVILTAFRYLATLIFGLVLYFVLNKFFLYATGQVMDTYMGLDRMGILELNSIPSILQKCYSNFFALFLHEYHGINPKSWLRLIMLLCFGFFVLTSLYQARCNKIDLLRFLILCVAIIVFPLAVGAIYIMVQDERAVCTMTVFSTIFIFFAPVFMADKLSQNINVQKAFALQLCLCVALGTAVSYYSSLANETYLSLEYANRNINAYYTELAAQIKSLDDFSPDLEVAFIGTNEDPTVPEIDCDYILRGTFTTSQLLNTYSREYFMTMHCGYSCNFVADTETIAQDERVQNMPAYPAAGSIAIIDGIIVVKFS